MTQHTKRISYFFQLLKQAIRGDEKEFTSGSITTAIVLLAVPMVLEMLLEALFALVDIYFVNRVGNEAVSIVVLTETVLTILYSVAWGLSMGVTALVARRVGEKNFDAASHIAKQAMIISVLLSIIISITGLFFSKELMYFMGASKKAVEEGYRYPQIMMGANLVIILLFVNNAIFRGAGDAAVAMRTLIIANIINMILDPLFILGIGFFPKLGVTGAAVATTIGRTCGVLYQFYQFQKGKSLIKFNFKNLKFDFDIIKQILLVSSGGTAQFIIGSCSWIFLARIVAQYGDEVTSGYGTAIRICIFTILPAWGMANAAATLVGQNLGAQQPMRAEKSVWKTAWITMWFFVLVTFIYFFLGEYLMRFFSSNAVAIKTGTDCLKILALGYIFFAYGMVISQAFNGAGDTRTPTKMNIIVYWLIQIPMAFLISKYANLGPSGVFISIGICEALMAVLMIILFKKGKWKLVRV